MDEQQCTQAERELLRLMPYPGDSSTLFSKEIVKKRYTEPYKEKPKSPPVE